MTGTGPARLTLAVLVLAAGAGAALAAGSALPSRSAARGREFQRLVGGLGLGPATDLSRCPNAFDPRVEGACSGRCEPLPAATQACPLHGASLLFP